RRGVLLEREMISKEDIRSKIDLEEIQESTDEEPIVNTNTQPEVVTSVEPDDISLPIRRTSGRVSKPPQFYYGFHIEKDKISDSTLSKLDEPANYKEAMASLEAAKWKEAMKIEIQWMSRLLFLTKKLTKDVFMAQPEGSENAKYPKECASFKRPFMDSNILLIAGISTSMRKSHRLDFLEAKMSPVYMSKSVGVLLSSCKDLCPKTDEELDRMSRVPYASAVGSIMYVMTCTRPDVSFALSMASRHQQNPSEGHSTAIKNILKYLRNTIDQFLVYDGEEELRVTDYCDASWQTDKDDNHSQSGWIFLLNGGAVTWKSSKQDTVADFTCESEEIAACEALKEAI
ncbi:hypothetical protein Tco_0945369, partial [Tanacetum coccineum]